MGLALALNQIGHKVGILSPGARFESNHEIKYFSYRGLGRPGHFINPFFSRALSRAVKTFFPQIIISEFPYQARMVIREAQKKQIPVIYDAHNVETLRFASSTKGVTPWLVRKTEAYMATHCSALLSVSQEDQDELERLYHRQSFLLPNGVETRLFSPSFDRSIELKKTRPGAYTRSHILWQIRIPP